MPASTGRSPSYETVSDPSKEKPSTVEPSGASALATNIPALDHELAVGAEHLQLARLSGKQVDHVVGKDNPTRRVVRAGVLEDDSDRGHVPRVRQHHTVPAALELEAARREIEQRRQVRRARHHVPGGAFVEVEDEDVGRERVEWRGDLAAV